MEVMIIPSQESDFDFRSGTGTSSPSTPKRNRGYYFSAPTSPAHLSQFYNDFDHFFTAAGDDSGGALATSTVPFDWEEKPGTPKSPARSENGDDFVFDVSQDWETASLSAEELFDGGVIKPLKPPPRLQLPPAARFAENGTSPSTKPISQTRKMIQGAFSPRHSKKKSVETDPFAVAARNAAARDSPVPERGRGRGVNLAYSPSRRTARSLSPLRDTQLYPWAEEKEQTNITQKNSSPPPPPGTVCSALSEASAKGQKKWRLKDFFLFRSASEGRAADKDPLKKYTAAFRRSSFGGTDSPRSGSGSGSGSRRRGPVSAHEMQYSVNRAVPDDLKNKTFVPCKQGNLGRLAFHPVVNALVYGFGFSRK